MQNLFYDQLYDQDIIVQASTTDESYPKLDVSLKYDKSMSLEHSKSIFLFKERGKPFRTVVYEGEVDNASIISTMMGKIKLFRFKTLEKYDNNQSDSLRPPNGDNLFSVVISSKALRETMTERTSQY